ncbi:hypothetical protein SDRG_15141 [Saprolegnia diclina VS20]|uniref:Uncharacterized protein n=1 Tax=Saprolegnia diclina (strain VS20) TaxID=1156394 RepID=T0RBV2_SAPDV|nr:hypothetical protein SDRG_15141 [Saprolegnia diclina VS20]EQC27027.1 hypothetical protein SDRG_15141 [Saprolegnia diclina VS20]|eukprot:XP_008619527.1 hypothetical protein SDRG_15141 [Saprolegnia diclina VS20]
MGTSAPCSAAQNGSYAQAIAATLSDSCAPALRTPYSATFSSVLAEEGSHFTLCQPACSEDLANYTRSVPSCDEVSAAVANLTSFRSFCYDVTHPTMDGGACTSTDAHRDRLVAGLEGLQWYCGSPACRDNMTARPGVCTTADIETLRNLAAHPVWTRCASALNMSLWSNCSAFLRTDMPLAWCATTCPEFHATMLTTEVPQCNLTTLPTYQRGELAPFFDMLSTAQAEVASLGVVGATAAYMAKFCPEPPTPTPTTTTTPTTTPTPTTPTPTPTTPSSPPFCRRACHVGRSLACPL